MSASLATLAPFQRAAVERAAALAAEYVATGAAYLIGRGRCKVARFAGAPVWLVPSISKAEHTRMVWAWGGRLHCDCPARVAESGHGRGPAFTCWHAQFIRLYVLTAARATVPACVPAAPTREQEERPAIPAPAPAPTVEPTVELDPRCPRCGRECDQRELEDLDMCVICVTTEAPAAPTAAVERAERAAREATRQRSAPKSARQTEEQRAATRAAIIGRETKRIASGWRSRDGVPVQKTKPAAKPAAKRAPRAPKSAAAR